LVSKDFVSWEIPTDDTKRINQNTASNFFMYIILSFMNGGALKNSCDKYKQKSRKCSHQIELNDYESTTF